MSVRQIYVNLPVADLEASKRFYAELGFGLNEEFTDENAACVVLADDMFVMLLTEDFFRGFIDDEIADTASTTEVITAISAESREEVDGLVERALAAGGSPHRPVMDGRMYLRSFKDPDGHVWEVFSM